MNLETVHIDKIINGGFGFTRLSSGQVALVRHVLPDESVTVRVDTTDKQYCFGELQRIEVENPARRKPPCRFYHRCGGCDLQHATYDTQLTIKKSIIQDLLYRQNDGNLRSSIPRLNSPIAAPQEWGYRQRIRLRVGKRGEIGFYRYRSHEVVAIDECLLAAPLINSTLAMLTASKSAAELISLSSEVELQLNPSTHQVVTVFSFARKARPADIKAAQTFCRESDTVEAVFFVGADFPILGPFGKTESETSTDRFAVHYPSSKNVIDPFILTWEPGGFCQVNLEQNRTLIETVLSLCRPDGSRSVLDLYCGMGNFSIPLAMTAKSVVGFEGQGSAIRSAKHNAQLAKLKNTNFSKRPIHRACEELLATGAFFECVVLDPPRQGAPGLAESIGLICKERLVYISCDPATLCRDLSDFSQHGFTITAIQPVDMFPQTHHIETVVLLEKTSPV